jgi:hypothetical protein
MSHVSKAPAYELDDRGSIPAEAFGFFSYGSGLQAEGQFYFIFSPETAHTGSGVQTQRKLLP